MGRRAVQQGKDVYAARTVDFSRDAQAVLVGRHAVRAPERLELLAADDLRVLERWGGALGGGATFARFTSDGRRLVVTDTRRNAVVLDCTADGHVVPLRSNVRAFSIARHAPRAVVFGDKVEVLDTTTGASVWNVSEAHHHLAAEAVVISADGTRLAVAGWDGGQVALLDVDSRRLVKVIASWTYPGTRGLALDASGRYLSLVGTGGSAAWELEGATRVATEELGEQRTAYTCQAFHPRLPLLVVGTRAGYVTVIDLETSACQYAEKVHEGRLWDVVVSDDGRRVASVGDEGDVYLQEWAEMEAIGLSRV